MPDIVKQLLIVCPLVFFAGLVDSISGGGGIISLPVYYAVGVPPRMALGTNKFASSCGTTIATLRFLKHKKVHMKAAAVSAGCALAGSSLGAQLALIVSELYLKYFLLFSLPVLAVFILRSKAEQKNVPEQGFHGVGFYGVCGLIGLATGAYDGFFGPGTGTFLILLFHNVVGFDLLTSSGNAKVVNLASNVAALLGFFLSGNIAFTVAVPAACASILGNYAGSHMALKNGAKVIKPAFIVVLVLLLLKVAFDIFGAAGALPVERISANVWRLFDYCAAN